MEKRGNIEWIEPEEMAGILGSAAESAGRMASANGMSSERTEEWELYSVRAPYCVSIACRSDEPDRVVAVARADDLESALADAQDANTPEELAARLIAAGASKDTETLAELERAVSKIEENLIRNRRSYAASRELIKYRKTLLSIKQRYDGVSDMTEQMLKRENADARIIHESRRRAERIVNEVKTLREFLSEVRDAYQAAVQVGQNRLMQTFTVIAAIFMPLQLVTGWFGMNLIMPEFRWKWAYPVVAAACAALVVVLLIVFKKRRWL